MGRVPRASARRAHRALHRIDCVDVKLRLGSGAYLTVEAGWSWLNRAIGAAREMFFSKCRFLETNAGLVAEHRTLESESRQGIERHSILRYDTIE